ncbi:MAG: hypothetical protein ACKO1F_18220 [Flammeovirgaceae bacterium]
MLSPSVKYYKPRAGEPRDLVIKKWCECSWAAYENSHAAIATLAKMELVL